jgi:hypothetical protein
MYRDLDPSQFLELIDQATGLLSGKKMITIEEGKVTVIGDVHADFQTFKTLKKKIEGKAVFLGDYADRGDQPVSVYMEVLRMFIDGQAVLLRGNHESEGVFPHELPWQLREVFGEESEEVERALVKFWERMPVSAIVENELWLAHGGVPTKKCNIEIEGITRRDVERPDDYMMLEIMWNDPWEKEGCGENYRRGVMYFFGKEATRTLIEALNVKVVVRSHEPQKVLKAEQDGMVVTVGSCAYPYGLTEAALLTINFEKGFRDGYDLAAKFGKVFQII